MDFTTDWEKMRDFFKLTQEEFLETYDYVSEEEYLATCKIVAQADNQNYEAEQKFIDTAITYKKYLADMLFYQAVNMKKEDLQDVLFFEEETTDSWTLEQCQIQYVKDQISFFESDNLENEVEEVWEKIK